MLGRRPTVSTTRQARSAFNLPRCRSRPSSPPRRHAAVVAAGGCRLPLRRWQAVPVGRRRLAASLPIDLHPWLPGTCSRLPGTHPNPVFHVPDNGEYRTRRAMSAAVYMAFLPRSGVQLAASSWAISGQRQQPGPTSGGDAQARARESVGVRVPFPQLSTTLMPRPSLRGIADRQRFFLDCQLVAKTPIVDKVVVIKLTPHCRAGCEAAAARDRRMLSITFDMAIFTYYEARGIAVSPKSVKPARKAAARKVPAHA